MSADVSQLESIRSQTLSQIAELRANPKPSYTVAGQTVSWQEYAESLQAAVDWCDRKITEAAPFEVRSQGGS